VTQRIQSNEIYAIRTNPIESRFFSSCFWGTLLFGSIPLRYWPAASCKLHGSVCITQLDGNLCYTCWKARGLVLTLYVVKLMWLHVCGWRRIVWRH